jgi:hypothetical protein
MIRLASIQDDTWVPYAKTNKELTDTFTNQVANSDDAYSPLKAYKVGEHCIYNNVLYKCITACSAGSWRTNQSCFEQTTLTGAVTDLNSALSKTLLLSNATQITEGTYNNINLNLYPYVEVVTNMGVFKFSTDFEAEQFAGTHKNFDSNAMYSFVVSITLKKSSSQIVIGKSTRLSMFANSFTYSVTNDIKITKIYGVNI